jgi:hypothetical protein
MGLGASILLCKRAKFRGSPKALITKLFKETCKVAWLMTQGIVISLEILVIGMGDRGSKSNYIKFVKEQRVDGSSININGKVYSSRRESRFLVKIK